MPNNKLEKSTKLQEINSHNTIKVNNKNINTQSDAEKNKKRTKKNRKDRHFNLRKSSFQQIAKSRIADLFSQASNVFNEDPMLSKRYVKLARNISTKHNVPFDKKQKICYCKSCGEFLKHGVNSTLRISKGNIVIKCLVCKHIQRFRVK